MAGTERVVIVGAGQAGAAAATELREGGFDGQVTLIGSELHAPYERPPLSKAYLRGERGQAQLSLHPEEWWGGRGVDLRRGNVVERIDRTGMSVELSDGTTVGYDWLILATGSAARTLAVPGSDLDGVLTLRTLDDADEIRQRAREAEHVLVIGGGWIGSEVTASLRQMDVPVTLAFPGELPLEHALHRPVAEVYDRLHQDNGATVLRRTLVSGLEGDERVRRARTGAGDAVAADLVVLAIGARPCLELARTAGLAIGDGVTVDGFLRTSDPRILAVGDIAEAPYPDLGRSLRFQHWGAAQSQGIHAARTVLGAGDPYVDLPYVFSDQYETGMEFWGDPLLPGRAAIRGSLEEKSFTAFWQDDQGLVRGVLNLHVHGHGGHGHGGHEKGSDNDLHEHEHEHEHGHDHGRDNGQDHDRNRNHGHDHRAHDPPGREHGGSPAGSHGPGGQHPGAHLDPGAVAALLRSRQPVNVRSLEDRTVPLESLVPR